MIFFDDVTPALFPGVVEGVDEIERSGDYDLFRFTLSPQRAYAWGSRVDPAKALEAAGDTGTAAPAPAAG